MTRNGDSDRRARPFFRPRVIVKFHDWVEVPYEDGAERHITEKYGGGIWERVSEQLRRARAREALYGIAAASAPRARRRGDAA
jgi:hypothetical protein